MDVGSAAPALAAAIGYLLGAIPFGIVLTRLAGAGDLRAIGSGNIGATNVLRTGRKGLAAATLLLDAVKGAAAVLIAWQIWPSDGVPGAPGMTMLAAATGAFAGHVFPVWLGFRGGKGVATYLGIALALSWPCGLGFALVWIGALAVTRFSSVGGMTAAVATPAVAAIAGAFTLAMMLCGLTLIVLWKHRANLERLMAGTEPRVGQRGGDAAIG